MYTQPTWGQQVSIYFLFLEFSKGEYLFKRKKGTSLVVQWLRLCLPMQGLQVWSLIRELRSHSSRGQKTTKNETKAILQQNSIKTLRKNCCCCPVTKLCLILCDPMDCSTPGFPDLHHLPEFAQTHVHWVGYTMKPSHSLSPTSPPALNISQHQGVFQWVNSSHQVTKVLELQLQCQSFSWIFRIYFLYDWLIWSPCSLRDSQDSSPAPQFKSINSSVLSLLYGPTLTSIHDYWKNHSFNSTDFCQQNDVSTF